MRRVLALAACAVLGSCGNQTTAGGGSDQPNSVDVLVLTENGQPAVGAAARWVSGTWNSEDTASTFDSVQIGPEAKVDAEGRLILERPASGKWHLEVIDSISRQVAVLDTVRDNAIRLLPASEWSGFIASKGSVPSEILLAGTSRKATIGQDRQFHFRWLPAGRFRALGRWSTVNRELASRYLDVGEIVVDDTLDGDSSEVVLMDLERRPLRCALRGVFWEDTVAGNWFTAYDMSSRITPVDFGMNPLSALRVVDGRTALHFSFRLGSSYKVNDATVSPWAGVGMGVAPDMRGLDWSGVTGIRILVRGRGVIRLQINTKAIDDVRSVLHFGSVVSLDDTWHWKEIGINELWSQNTSGISWSQAAKGVHAIAFYAMQSDVQLDVADVRVRGSIAPPPASATLAGYR